MRVKAEPQFNLTDDSYTEPDIVVRPAAILMPDVRGETALLVIEIADTSFEYDTTTKAALYAAHGVRDYWVVDVRTRITRVFRQPTPTGFSDVRDVTGDETLVPLLAPVLAVRLADLGTKAG